MPKRSRKPVDDDANTLAARIVRQATGEKRKPTDEELIEQAKAEGKNPAAVLLGRSGGLKGGKARAAKLSKQRRKQIAKKAASIRWSTH